MPVTKKAIKPVAKKVLKKSKKQKKLIVIYSLLKQHFFLLKILLALVLVLVSYRYSLPIDSFSEQGIYTLIVAFIFVLWKPSPLYSLVKRSSVPKLMWTLVFLTFVIPPLAYADTKYKDWDNAQMIKGLARDFPELVAQIEAETGLDLEEKTECMTTSEKFSSGVKLCEFLFYADGETEEQTVAVFEIVEKNPKFKKDVLFENQEGYTFKYRNKESCSFANKDGVYGSCVMGIREVNTGLAISTLSSRN